METILTEQRRIRKKLDILEASMKAVVSHSNQHDLVETVAQTSLDLPAKSIQEMQSIEKALESTEIFQNLVSVYAGGDKYVCFDDVFIALKLAGNASVLSIPA